MRKGIINDLLNRIEQLEKNAEMLECAQDGDHNLYYYYRRLHGEGYDYVFRCRLCAKEVIKTQKQITDAQKKAMKTLKIL